MNMVESVCRLLLLLLLRRWILLHRRLLSRLIPETRGILVQIGVLPLRYSPNLIYKSPFLALLLGESLNVDLWTLKYTGF